MMAQRRPSGCGVRFPRLGAVSLLISSSSLVACHLDDVGAIDSASLRAGMATIAVTTEPALSLRHDGELRLRFEPSDWQFGIVERVDNDTNYDPHRILTDDALYSPPDGLRWIHPRAARFEDADDGESIRLQLEFESAAPARLTIRVEEDGRFSLKLTPSDDRVAFFRLRPHASADEGFYGLGEYYDEVDHRGQRRALQLEIDAELDSGYNEAHVPVPLLIGTEGWGLFVESPYAASIAVGTEKPGRIDASFGTGLASAEGLRFHLFAESHPLDITRHYYQVTGYPKLPARWALGPLVWRDENDNQQQVEADIEAMRDLDLAATGYWIDRPYASAVNTFDYSPAMFSDPAAMIARMHALGFRTALWHTPYLDESRDETAALRAHAESKGYYPPVTGAKLNKWGMPIDVTDPQAVAWWQELLGSYIKLGVEGFKLDYGEDVVCGLNQKRLRWRFDNGADERTMQSQFQRHYHAIYADLMPEDGGFLLCRAGTYGDQTSGCIIWPGDLDANMKPHRTPIDPELGEASKRYVGGLPAALVAGLSLSPSGFPFFGSDTGGYKRAPPDKETFTRWFQYTALSTVMQIGTSSNDVAWEPTPGNGFDEEMLGWYRRYTRLHLRLFPYIWSYAVRLAHDGRPIQRALGLAYPELGEHPNDTYLLGDALLVAPVVTRGARQRSLVLPPGDWIDWWSGKRHRGPGRLTVDAPLDTLPLFVSAAHLVPMLRPTIDSLAATSEPQRVDSYATEAGALYVRAVAEGNGHFRLFDGGSLDHTTTTDRSELSFAGGSELNNGVVFELIAASAPVAVEAGGQAIDVHVSLASLEAATTGYFFDDSPPHTLWVKASGAAANVSISWR
jgi:alpha-D-xyloside xylohydrolase